MATLLSGYCTGEYTVHPDTRSNGSASDSNRIRNPCGPPWVPGEGGKMVLYQYKSNILHMFDPQFYLYKRKFRPADLEPRQTSRLPIRHVPSTAPRPSKQRDRQRSREPPPPVGYTNRSGIAIAASVGTGIRSIAASSVPSPERPRAPFLLFAECKRGGKACRRPGRRRRRRRR